MWLGMDNCGSTDSRVGVGMGGIVGATMGAAAGWTCWIAEVGSGGRGPV